MKRRPDVRAAERELAATYSDIGDEMAEYFPKITLFGSFGWTSQSRDRIGEPETERWSYGPSISWSFLDFGASTSTSRPPKRGATASSPPTRKRC
jgi:multidrug efflux system outer membrane protein